MMDKTDIQAGSLIVFATGEYSDYGYEGHYVALETIPRSLMVEIAEEAKMEHKVAEEEEMRGWTEFHKSSEPNSKRPEYVGSIHNYFIGKMIRRGLLLSLTVTQLHIGSYGELEIPA